MGPDIKTSTLEKKKQKSDKGKRTDLVKTLLEWSIVMGYTSDY